VRRVATRFSLPKIAAILALGALFLTVLGYGGDNFALGPVPIPLVWLLIALLTALVGFRGAVLLFRWHPWLFALWLTVLAGGLVRLLVDYGRFGLWAVRSSVFFVASVGVPVGMYLGWQLRTRSWHRFVVAPALASIVYTLSYPWQESLLDLSPRSGVFNEVPLLGSYAYFDTATAAVWAGFLGGAAPGLKWGLLIVVTLLDLAFVQGRLAYLSPLIAGLAVSLVLPRGYRWRVIAWRGVVATSIIAGSLLVASVLPIPGRWGNFQATLLLTQLKTIWGEEGPGQGSIEHRRTEYPVAIRNLLDAPVATLVAGEGLGTPIELGVTGIYIRRLHLDYVEVIYRTGAVGILWILLVIGLWWTVLSRIKLAIGKKLISAHNRIAALMVCGILTISLVRATHQPLFFWAYGAFPFFFYSGLALGVTRGLEQNQCARHQEYPAVPR